MDTSPSQQHEEVDILNCPICSLKLKDPKELKCRCVFCHRCIEKHLRSPIQDNAKCPACKSSLENPPELKNVSRPLEKLLMTNQAARCKCESPGCDQTVRVPHICVKCQLWLCPICKTFVCHGVIKNVQTKPVHEACPSKHLTPELSGILISNRFKTCLIHEDDFVSYCENCHICVCNMCIYDKHPHHALTDIKKKSESYRNKLLGQSKSLKKKIQDHEAALRIYSDMVNSPSTPKIVSVEECKHEAHMCQKRIETCDCLVKCITQLDMLGSMETILKIGRDIQENILYELSLLPLNDIQAAAKWLHAIENTLNVVDSTEHDSKRMDQHETTEDDKTTETKEQQQTTTASTSGTIPNESRKDTSQHKPSVDKTLAGLTKESTDRKRTTQTRASASYTIPDDDRKKMTTASAVTLKEKKTAIDVTNASSIAAESEHQERASTSAVKEHPSMGIKRNLPTKVSASITFPVDERKKIKTSRAETSKGKAPTGMKRTIQTRSCTARTNTGDGLRDQGSGKAKRPRMVSSVDENSTTVGTSSAARTRKGSTGTFQSLSMPSVRYASFTLSNSVDQAKVAIAQAIGQDERYLDILDSGRVVEGGEMVMDIHRPLQVVVHNRNRQVPVTHQTESPDMVNSWEEGPRMAMSCGHAIIPENLYKYCLCQLENQRSSFRCFAEVDGGCFCDREWLFVEVAEKACLSNDEHHLFESRINRNWMNHSAGVRECPFCRLACERQDTTNACVNCVNCQEAGKPRCSFCWYCLAHWTDRHTCEKISLHRMLSHCDKKEIVEITGCPSIRACPTCHNLIEHTEGCKHMTCMNCRCTFCFVCLGVRGDEGFACGSYDALCEVAPIQSVT